MIDKSKFRNLKGRRIYLFWLDENTGEITDVTSRSDVVQVIRCKDCKHWLPHTQFGYDADYEEYHNYCNRHLPDDDFYAFIKEAEDYCSWAERKDEYVTLHHEDIHFNSEEDEKAFYEVLAEMKNTMSFTAEEWEFYKKVNREKMQKTGLNIRNFMGAERKEE